MWQQLIETHSEAVELKNKRVQNYDKTLKMYRKDRTDGAGCETICTNQRQR